MKFLHIATSILRQLALPGMLFVAVTITPCVAVELTGTPVGAGTLVDTASATPVPDGAALHENHDDPADRQIEHAMSNLEPLLEGAFSHRGHDDHDFFADPEILLAVIVVTCVFGGPTVLIILLVILYYRAKARRQKNINDNIERLLAAGRDIPIELLRGDEPYGVDGDSNLHRGMKNLGLGTGLLIFLSIMFGYKIGAFGFIWMSVGASQLLLWKLTCKTANVIPDSGQVSDQVAN